MDQPLRGLLHHMLTRFPCCFDSKGSCWAWSLSWVAWEMHREQSKRHPGEDASPSRCRHRHMVTHSWIWWNRITKKWLTFRENALAHMYTLSLGQKSSPQPWCCEVIVQISECTSLVLQKCAVWYAVRHCPCPRCYKERCVLRTDIWRLVIKSVWFGGWQGLLVAAVLVPHSYSVSG